MITALAAVLSFSGIYEQDCSRGFGRAQEFSGGSVVYVETNYRDSGCEQPSLRVRNYGNYTVEKSRPGAIREMDFFFSAVTLTPLDASVAEFYREKKICGRDDWALGEESDITGRDCEFFPGNVLRVPHAGEARYGIVKEEGTDLYFGALTPERNALDPGRRPLSLDPRPYRRRNSL